MRKVLTILLLIGFIFTSGCTKFNKIQNSIVLVNDTSNSKPSPMVNSPSNKADANKADANIEIIDNSFFYKSNISQVNYKGKFAFDDIVEQDVSLNINELATLKNGKLYELKLESFEGAPNARLSLGYFYVQNDKIYKIEPTEENLSKIKTSEELPDGGVIVCQDSEIIDTLGEEEPGFHHYMEVNGDKREYHSYNNQVSTGYYESFTWEKGKGLISYRSGFGAESESIELEWLQKLKLNLSRNLLLFRYSYANIKPENSRT